MLYAASVHLQKVWILKTENRRNINTFVAVCLKMVLLPFILAIDLVSDWEERSKWDKTFDGVSFLDQMADFKVLKWYA